MAPKTKKKRENCTRKKRRLRFEPSTVRSLGRFVQKPKQNPLPENDASTSEAARRRVGRNERGEARRANTTPNGGPHLELYRAFTAQNLV